MDESTAAFIMDVAPAMKRVEYSQIGIRRTLKDWKGSRPDDFHTAISSSDLGVAVGYNIRYEEGGQYGWETGLHFKQDHTPEGIDEETLELADDMYHGWIEHIIGAIEDDVETTLFSPTQLAAFYGSRNKKYNEKRIADGLGISVGTYRGKIGRVREKLERARNTLQLNEAAPEEFDDGPGSVSAHFSVIERVPEDQLPVSSTHRVDHPDIQIKDVPVDKVINENPAW